MLKHSYTKSQPFSICPLPASPRRSPPNVERPPFHQHPPPPMQQMPPPTSFKAIPAATSISSSNSTTHRPRNRSSTRHTSRTPTMRRWPIAIRAWWSCIPASRCCRRCTKRVRCGTAAMWWSGRGCRMRKYIYIYYLLIIS